MEESDLKRHRDEVEEAYVAAYRLRLYARIAGLGGILSFMAVLGGIIVGWLGVSEGVAALSAAALLTVGTATKLYDQSFRTSVSAAGLQRSLNFDEDLAAAASPLKEKLKVFSLAAVVVTALGVVGIMGYSVANEGTRTEGDDDDRSGEVDDDDDAEGSDDSEGGDDTGDEPEAGGGDDD
jgi:hypothetical protein